jgi:uncharacterized protein DUF1579
MTLRDNEAPPRRGAQHEALAVFLGTWHATGKSYGIPERPENDPRSAAQPWVSTHTATWHPGKFFLIQDEHANPGDNRFDTLSIMGVDARTKRYFARTFENHGFYRHYEVAVDGRIWTFLGDLERAQIELSADGNTQTITWEWRPTGRWLPLCDRVAVRTD